MAANKTTGGSRPNYYLLETYYLRHGAQLQRIHQFMNQGFSPAAHRIHPGPQIFLEGVVSAHLPQFVAILGLDSASDATGLRSQLQQDTAFRQAAEEWESGPEPPYEHFSQILLRAADYSPPVDLARRAREPRLFELRVYHSPAWSQLAALHNRFAGPEIKIFHRVGIHPVLYCETAIGPNMPNLTYLTPFDSLAAREAAWNAFAADPEWVKVRKASVDAHGQIASVIHISLLKATSYSPFM